MMSFFHSGEKKWRLKKLLNFIGQCLLSFCKGKHHWKINLENVSFLLQFYINLVQSTTVVNLVTHEKKNKKKNLHESHPKSFKKCFSIIITAVFQLARISMTYQKALHDISVELDSVSRVSKKNRVLAWKTVSELVLIPQW